MRVVHSVDDERKFLELSLSDDKQKLFAHVEAREQSHLVSFQEIMHEIGSVSPEELIDKDVVRDIAAGLQAGQGCDSRRVARGKLPSEGRDGKVVWLARRFSPGNHISEEREFSDFFTLGLFENIEVGMEVARVYKPAGGTPGVDALGNEIAARGGRPLSTRWDSSIEFRDDPQHEHYTVAVARVAGYLQDDGLTVAIRDTLVVPTNLDWGFGHIDFIGNVQVGGDVQKGFHIKARGNIDIKGSVIGESVLSSHGSLRIRGYHQGIDVQPTVVGGDYLVSIANSVTANVGGNIIIEREARDCSLSAGVAVFATKAAIVGGSIWCVRGLEVDILGNEAGVTTVVELKNELEVTREYRSISVSIQKHETAVAALELHIGPYLKNRRRVPLLKKEFRVKISALLEKYDAVVASLSRLRQQEREMRESKSIQTDARISVSGVIHAGVILRSGDVQLEVKETLRGPISFCRSPHQSEWVPEKFQSVQRG